MSDDEVITTHGTTELTIHRRGSRIALTLPVAPMSDIDLGKVEPIGRITLGDEQPWKMNYLGIDQDTGALVRGYLINNRHPESASLDELSRNTWLAVRELPVITEVFIGTDKDL
ncbi:hypothetical protein [Mycobacterium noviomagense]|uniref:Uncharacterized protein n=1 Tax=Mycobacterium noviomagense TaxID=459858 RepID=A0A7I7PA16_9MYCO|nr:hypothetical protein [Mycobacterium noviomagense]ORB12999.1 hypothetical protein BST37_14930 [Mycobacterium noviomagense]BBY05414.1 hypothetical protein MNVI_07320 [Mycobacterium noviomagense]